MVNWIKRRIKRFGIKFLMWEKGTKLFKPEGEKTDYVFLFVENLLVTLIQSLVLHQSRIKNISSMRN